MTRGEIDKKLKDALLEAGLKNYQIGWSASPARLFVLIGNDQHEFPISTRLTKRAIEDLLHKLSVLGGIQRSHRERRAEYLA